MKPISRLQVSKITSGRIARSQILSVLFLLFLTSLTWTNPAVAYPEIIQNQTTIAQRQGDRTTRLPAQVAIAVRRDLSSKTQIPIGKLRITGATAQDWPDGCLGLPQPEEVCTLAILPGWRVVVSDGSRNWVYRTNNNGSVVRLEPTTNQTNNGGRL
jgi:hypothetical protein